MKNLFEREGGTLQKKPKNPKPNFAHVKLRFFSPNCQFSNLGVTKVDFMYAFKKASSPSKLICQRENSDGSTIVPDHFRCGTSGFIYHRCEI